MRLKHVITYTTITDKYSSNNESPGQYCQGRSRCQFVGIMKDIIQHAELHHEYVIRKTQTKGNSAGQTVQIPLEKQGPHFS